MQACVRGSWHLASQKLSYLNDLPYLLVRIHEAGVRDRCVELWNGIPVGERDQWSVASEFMVEGSPLRDDIDAMRPDGSNMSARLVRAIRGLSLAPLDDSVGESPHASMRHTQLKCRAASWPFQAATDRLSQNLRDVDDILPGVRPRTDLQWLWDRDRTVIQCDRAKLGRNARLKKRELDQRIYTMNAFRAFHMEDMPGDDEEYESDGPPADDGAGEDAGGRRGDPVGDGRGFHSALCAFYQKAFDKSVGQFIDSRGRGYTQVLPTSVLPPSSNSGANTQESSRFQMWPWSPVAGDLGSSGHGGR